MNRNTEVNGKNTRFGGAFERLEGFGGSRDCLSASSLGCLIRVKGKVPVFQQAGVGKVVSNLPNTQSLRIKNNPRRFEGIQMPQRNKLLIYILTNRLNCTCFVYVCHCAG